MSVYKKRHTNGDSYTVITDMILCRELDGEDIETPITVTGYFEPEQKGGLTDPSWNASITLESVTTSSGRQMVLTPSEVEAATEMLWKEHNGDDDA